MSRSRRRLPAVLLVMVAAFAAPVQPQEQALWGESYRLGSKLLTEDKFSEAAEAFERANELAGGRCGRCLLGLAHAQAVLKKWKQSAEAARRAVTLLGDSPTELARAYVTLGVALVERSHHRENLAEAESLLRKARELPGEWAIHARYNLGEVLMVQERYAEAAEDARVYLRASPKGEIAKRARILLCQARRHLPEELLDSLEGPMTVADDVKRPEKIAGRPPFYTDSARFAKVQGVVIAEAIIDSEGCVRGVRPLKELPDGLTEAAVDAMKAWVFEPATLAGKPVRVYYTLTVLFQVE